MSTLAIVVASAVVGLIGGAGVPLVAYRLSVPMGEPARTACAECGRPFPGGLTGWVTRRPRCPQCARRWGLPPALTAAAGGVAAGLVAWLLRVAQPPQPRAVIALFVAMAIFGVLLAVIDLACLRLPHLLVVPATGVAAVAFLGVAAFTGDWSSALRAAEGAAVFAAVFLVLYLLPGGGLGFGDVKLAVLLGIFLGWVGWPAVWWGAMMTWLVNAPFVLVQLARRRVGRRSMLPLGPAMLGGALLAVAVSSWLSMVGRP